MWERGVFLGEGGRGGSVWKGRFFRGRGKGEGGGLSGKESFLGRGERGKGWVAL